MSKHLTLIGFGGAGETGEEATGGEGHGDGERNCRVTERTTSDRGENTATDRIPGPKRTRQPRLYRWVTI